MISFGARSLIDLFFDTNIKSSALNFFAKLTLRLNISAKANSCQTPSSQENDENPFKVWIHSQRASGGIWQVLLLTSGRTPPHTPTETFSAVHYLLTDSRFESICILLLTGIYSDLHFTALGRGRGGRGGVVKMKHCSIWWKSFTCKTRGKWANRLGGVQTQMMSRCVHRGLAIR